MADPVTLGIAGLGAAELAGIGTAATVGGGLLSAFSGIFGGEAESSKYKYQAGMSRLNANINRQNRDMAIHSGEAVAQQSGMKTALQTSSIRAGQGASGTLVDSGTNADVVESQHAVGKQDQDMIRWNAEKAAYGFDVKALEDEASAGMYERGAKDAKTAGYINAMGSLIGTAGSVSDKWLKAKHLGMGSGGGSTYAEDNKWEA